MARSRPRVELSPFLKILEKSYSSQSNKAAIDLPQGASLLVRNMFATRYFSSLSRFHLERAKIRYELQAKADSCINCDLKITPS
jgi:hypothetical protein